MTSQILFKHIPKTGGTTLRIIFNRVYGAEKVFFINSTDIAGSLAKFRDFRPDQRREYHVISGHGACFFRAYLNQVFKVSILREPVSLFYSQYYYLRSSPNSVFLDEVSKIPGPEAYLDYAIRKGQDNLLTRYFSESVSFLVNDDEKIPLMDQEGGSLLEQAKENLAGYYALLDLSTFDKGVFALSKKLNWKEVPLYRAANVNRASNLKKEKNDNFEKELRHFLRFDIALYDYFVDQKLDIANQIKSSDLSWKLFSLKQKSINSIVRIIK